MEYPAHIKYEKEERFVQTVAEHLRAVANYAQESLSAVGLGSTGYLCGLLHDMGKYTHKYADYIERAARGERVERGSVNHTFAGVIFALERWHQADHSPSDVTVELIAYAAGAHHGEFDVVDMQFQNGFLHRLEKNRQELHYAEALAAFSNAFDFDELDRLFEQAVLEIEAMLTVLPGMCKTQRQLWFYFGMLARLLLSALIDADRQDAAEFEHGFAFPQKTVPEKFWEDNLRFFEEKLAVLPRNPDINRARRAFSDLCLQKAALPEGIYRLNMPTGGGKTLSTLRYALAHNKEHGKQRAIFIIPLLSVLEQNSDVIQKHIQSRDMLLEHHSNVVQEKAPEGKPKHDELQSYELLTQTWGKPFVISTLVQLLNMLFSHKTSDIRRMISLINSTIVIDEVQSLPLKTISMFNMAMNFLSAVCKTTVVLSSATQPVFEAAKYPMRFAEQADIVSYDKALLLPFKRTEIVDRRTKYGMDAEELEEFTEQVCGESRSVLLICNKKATALDLFRRLERLKQQGWNVFHLSTSMCPAHRRKILAEINASLDNETEKTLCIATQLVEAGIDFSFESVIRVLAGMDNIAQAAGRCNRSGEFHRLCKVYIVNLKQENLRSLKEIQTAQHHAGSFLDVFGKTPAQFADDPLSESSIRTYYDFLFHDTDVRSSMDYPSPSKEYRYPLFELLSENTECAEASSRNNAFVLRQAFRTANGAFQVFDENTTDIIVPYGEGKEIIADLYSEKAKHDMAFLFATLEQARPYSISVFEYTKKQLEDGGMLKAHENGYFITLDPRGYNTTAGLDVNGDNYFESDDSVFQKKGG